MTTEIIIGHSLSKIGAVMEYPFGPDPAVFKVGGKIFVMLYQKSGVVKIGMKCEAMLADMLRQKYPSVTPFFRSDKWISILCDGGVPDDEILHQIDISYELCCHIDCGTKKTRYRPIPFI